jgi:hypothetical protein
MSNDQNKEEIVIDAEDVAEVPALPQPKEGETVDWKAEAEKYQGMATRRGTKLSKLKGAKPEPVVPADQAPKKGELDYGQKAFLVANGVKEAEDMALVQKTMTDTGRSLEDVLATPYVQAELKRLGEERATKAAAPGPQDRGNAPAKNTVDYWMAKGGLPPADGTPATKKLREDIVNARAAKEKSGNVFAAQSVVK